MPVIRSCEEIISATGVKESWEYLERFERYRCVNMLEFSWPVAGIRLSKRFAGMRFNIHNGILVSDTAVVKKWMIGNSVTILQRNFMKKEYLNVVQSKWNVELMPSCVAGQPVNVANLSSVRQTSDKFIKRIQSISFTIIVFYLLYLYHHYSVGIGTGNLTALWADSRHLLCSHKHKCEQETLNIEKQNKKHRRRNYITLVMYWFVHDKWYLKLAKIARMVIIDSNIWETVSDSNKATGTATKYWQQLTNANTSLWLTQTETVTVIQLIEESIDLKSSVSY
jgi:hypothetical protein